MKLLLLLYVPRSGSTFFASLVARHFKQIMVLPELRLPKLLISGDVAASDNPRQALLELVKRDHQFAVLDLSLEEIERCFDRMESYTAEAILLEIAQAIAHKKNISPELVLYKCGSAGNRWPELRERMPETGFVHVYRDARAAVNSAMHTERPYHPGQKMGRGDPWYRARAWNAFVSRMGRLKAEGEPIHEIKYEELCESPDRVLQGFAVEIGIPWSENGGADFTVSSKEEAIHTNVGRDAMAERTDGWKAEMPRWQGLVVEHLASGQLLKRNYSLYYSAQTNLPGRLVSLIYGYVYHLVATAYFHGRRIFRRPSPGNSD